jgi:hypothetical protein
MPARYARFLEVHPPDAPPVPCTDAAIAPWRDRVPDALVAFWTEVGWGSFGQGRLHVVDPASLDSALELWLGGSSPTRIAIARTAFGEIFYYRDLREAARARGMSGTLPGELGDVSVIDVHFAQIGVFALEVEAFFNDTLCHPKTVDMFLRRSFVELARGAFGPLTEREGYAFVPALALGGVEDALSVRKVDMHVHWSILRQLVAPAG